MAHSRCEANRPTGQGDEDFNDIAVAPEDSRMMLARFGMDVIRKYRKISMDFMGI